MVDEPLGTDFLLSGSQVHYKKHLGNLSLKLKIAVPTLVSKHESYLDSIWPCVGWVCNGVYEIFTYIYIYIYIHILTYIDVQE